MSSGGIKLLVYIILALLEDRSTKGSHICSGTYDELTGEYNKIRSNTTIRKVNLITGKDDEECLNVNRVTEPQPCHTMEYALHGKPEDKGDSSNLEVHLSAGVYQVVNTSTIINSINTALIGVGNDQTVIVCGVNSSSVVPCDFLDFQIRNSSHVLVSNITFTGCGPITSSLYLGSSDHIFIQNCTFKNDSSSPLLIYDTPNVQVSDCSFNNNNPKPLNHGITHSNCYHTEGNNSDLFFLYNRSSDGSLFYYLENATTNLIISNCDFTENNARPEADISFIRRSKGYGQGGALNIRLLNTTKSTICVINSNFKGNKAEAYAGALSLTVADSSTDNKIIVMNSSFDSNKCRISDCTGGAVGIYFYLNTARNSILFENCSFTNNEARSSGAMVLSTSVSAAKDEGDRLQLVSCIFKNNTAFYEGTALGIFSLTRTDEIGISVELTDCLFTGNAGSDESIDTSAITIYRVLLVTRGNTTFHNNKGGAISLLSSRLDVQGVTLLDGNMAVYGAGVAMSGRSLILLYQNSSMYFFNNYATKLGAGIYMDDTSSDFTLSILNIGCFIRYNTREVDLPPNEWNTTVIFQNNTALIAGAGIYSNDMSQCQWLGSACSNSRIKPLHPSTIFNLSSKCSPFKFENNTVDLSASTTYNKEDIKNEILATDSTAIHAKADFLKVGYSEQISINLSSTDEQGNFRESVWHMTAPGPQLYGTLSSDNTLFTYTVPNKSELLQDKNVQVQENRITFNIIFDLLYQSSKHVSIDLQIVGNGCHPGYIFSNKTQSCSCLHNEIIVRCDSSNRYFYAVEGFWVDIDKNGAIQDANTIPGFLHCNRQGSLPGCKIQFDSKDEQCAEERQGKLCSQCKENRGITFDLHHCKKCDYKGIISFLIIVVLTPVMSLIILYFDFPLPNELKGVIFYGQVVGVIYRSSPYLTDDGYYQTYYDFIANMFGLAMPIPFCMHKKIPALAMAFLGYVPPCLALLSAALYWFCARHVKFLSHREKYGFHGFYFLLFFVYKYIIDTSFIFVSCTKVGGKQVFLYDGSEECYKVPHVFLLMLGCAMLLVFGIILPLYVLKIIYSPGKMINVRNVLTHGLKEGKKYQWYGVWDLWRRLLFVAAGLLISVARPPIVLLIIIILILLCLGILCTVQPYKEDHINVIECLMILALMSSTLSVYDRDNDFHIGALVGKITLLTPFIYGSIFIFYHVIMFLFKKSWKKLKETKIMEDKVKNIEKKYLILSGNFKGRMMNLVGEEAEDEDLLSVDSPSNKKGLRRSFGASLREPLLDDSSRK